MGYLLVSPLRRWLQDPAAVLKPYVREGMTVLEPGPGMGFFTLELARLAGPQGRVIAVDVQPKMLSELARRAAKAGVGDRLELRQPKEKHLGVDDLNNQVDFVLAFAVVHELPDQNVFFADAFAALKAGGSVLLAEPSGHVNEEAWERTVACAERAGFHRHDAAAIKRSRTVRLLKPA
jgi:ubiquinone/menaquinone biosynthesis C-methylase UbiE